MEKIKPLLHRIGLTMLFVGLSAAIMWPMQFWIGGTIWVLGCIVILLGHETWGTKLSLIALTFFGYFMYQVIFYVNNRSEPETFLIPEGYRGKVRVIYDQPRGTPEVREEKRVVYQIGDTGVFLTKVQMRPGFVDWQFYTVKPDGTRIPLPYRGAKSENMPDDVVGVRELQSERFANQNSMRFYIGTKADVERLDQRYEQKADSLAKALMR